MLVVWKNCFDRRSCSIRNLWGQYLIVWLMLLLWSLTQVPWTSSMISWSWLSSIKWACLCSTNTIIPSSPQVLLCQRAEDVILVTFNHIDTIRTLVGDSEAHIGMLNSTCEIIRSVSANYLLFTTSTHYHSSHYTCHTHTHTQHYSHLSTAQFILLRSTLLTAFQDTHKRVSSYPVCEPSFKGVLLFRYLYFWSSMLSTAMVVSSPLLVEKCLLGLKFLDEYGQYWSYLTVHSEFIILLC